MITTIIQRSQVKAMPLTVTIEDELANQLKPYESQLAEIVGLGIKELRARAEKALGPKFSYSAFHDEVLDSGALPLDVLEARVNAWIASQTQGQTQGQTETQSGRSQPAVREKFTETRNQ